MLSYTQMHSPFFSLCRKQRFPLCGFISVYGPARFIHLEEFLYKAALTLISRVDESRNYLSRDTLREDRLSLKLSSILFEDFCKS